MTFLLNMLAENNLIKHQNSIPLRSISTRFRDTEATGTSAAQRKRKAKNGVPKFAVHKNKYV